MEEETRIFENHAQDARYRDAGDCAPTCHSQMGTGGNNVPLVYTKTAHPRNAEESQGFREAEVAKTLNTFGTPNSEMRAEELVCFQQNQRDEVREMEVPGALQAEPGMKQQSFVAVLVCNKEHANAVNRNNGLENCVCYPINSMVLGKDIREGDRQTTGIGKDDDPCPTLQVEHHHAVAQCRPLSETAAIGFNPGQSKDGGLGLEEGVSPNIRANSSANDPAVAIAENIIGRKPENGGHQLGVNETGAAYTQEAMSPQGVCHNATVRRLLPVECERLQGFPDGHTVPCFRPEDITDELVERFIEIHYEWSKIENGDKAKRKSAKQVRDWLEKISNPDTCPDAPRYKAVGNSMAVNCMEWLGRRIQMVEDRINKEDGR